MARAAPSLSVVISLLGLMVVLCGGIVIMMRYGETQLKDHEQKEAKRKGKEPTGPYAEQIKKLTASQFNVTQRDQDDVSGQYVNTTAPGLYLDLISDEVLFSSRDKLTPVFDMTEFAKPVDDTLLIEEPEMVNGEPRIRVKSKKALTRLGWKGKTPEGQTRYFLNSTALKFVPEADLEKAGLKDQQKLLEKP